MRRCLLFSSLLSLSFCNIPLVSLPPALMLLFGCHCISIFLPLEKRGLSGIRTRDVVMNDLGMVWGFDGYVAAPGSRVTALQRAMPAIKNQLCIYVSASMNFFFFSLVPSGVDLYLFMPK